MDAGRRVLEERGRRDPLIHGSQHEQETKEELRKIAISGQDREPREPRNLENGGRGTAGSYQSK